MPALKVAIVGAGPVGLMLARLLHCQHGIDVVVFESDSSRHARKQGGSLDLHPQTGLAALKAGGLYEAFLRRARFDGEAAKLFDKRLTLYLSAAGATEKTTRGRPEIDRTSLREMLIDSLPETTIRWGCRLRSVDEERRLIFDHGIESGFDIIVGADGVWSKVRRRITDQQPEYSGVAGFSWTIPDAEKTAPACYSLTNRGSVFAFSDGKTIMAQFVGDGSINVYTWSVQPENRNTTAKYDTNSVEQIKAALLQEFKDWHPRLLDYLIKGQDPVMRPLYMLPVGWKWEHHPGITLIGDAAHVMTPYAGEGVNLGLQDALKLSQAIIKASLSTQDKQAALRDHVKEFEDDMFIRARRTAHCTLDMLNWTMFTDGAPRSVIEKCVLRLGTFHMDSLHMLFIYPLLTVAVYFYFAFFKLFH